MPWIPAPCGPPSGHGWNRASISFWPPATGARVSGRGSRAPCEPWPGWPRAGMCGSFIPFTAIPTWPGPAHAILAGLPHVTLLDPLPYVPFVDLMRRCRLIITDSGGIQEEAPSLGKPVLVLRVKTERPEAVEAGTVKLVGSDEDLIVAEAGRLLDDPAEYARMTRIHNPYGDGHACERIARVLAEEEREGRFTFGGQTRRPATQKRPL